MYFSGYMETLGGILLLWYRGYPLGIAYSQSDIVVPYKFHIIFFECFDNYYVGYGFIVDDQNSWTNYLMAGS